ARPPPFETVIPALLCSVIFVTPMLQDSSPSILDSVDYSGFAEHEVTEIRDAINRCIQGEYESAVPVLERYAEEGEIASVFVLGKLYAGGKGVPKSPERAARLLRSNVAKSHAPSMITLGELLESSSPDESLQLYRQAAAGNDPLGFYKLGEVYELGRLGERSNGELAFDYFEKLAALGDGEGESRLARYHDEGRGVPADVVKATRLYRKAALGGHLPSMVTLSRRYFAGQGLDADPVAAVGWLTRASQLGSTEAQVLLGLRYEMGDATFQDLNEAGQLYSRAAAAGNPEGKFHLGRLYRDGIGTEADPVRAYVLFAEAQGYPRAQEALTELETKLSAEQRRAAMRKLEDAGSEKKPAN
ncbi:MAG: tetratricopeptide repeat protein, partial [Verrucomicrobiota bacterium]